MYYSLNHNEQIISVREDIPKGVIPFSSDEINLIINANDGTISTETNIEIQVNDISDEEVSLDIEKIDENNDSVSTRQSKRVKIPKKVYPIEDDVIVYSITIPKVYVTTYQILKF